MRESRETSPPLASFAVATTVPPSSRGENVANHNGRDQSICRRQGYPTFQSLPTPASTAKRVWQLDRMNSTASIYFLGSDSSPPSLFCPPRRTRAHIDGWRIPYAQNGQERCVAAKADLPGSMRSGGLAPGGPRCRINVICYLQAGYAWHAVGLTLGKQRDVVVMVPIFGASGEESGFLACQDIVLGGGVSNIIMV